MSESGGTSAGIHFTIDGYEIHGRLGVGGMATVYRATQTAFGRRVAIKVVDERFVSDESFLKRFQREAQTAAAFSHPNIVPVHDLGVTSDGRPYLAMELVEGGSLRDLLDEEGALEPRQAIRITRDLASALEQIHGNRVVHRDLKPENVLMRAGTPCLSDFGIAKLLDANTQLTQGGVVGTAKYVSPEQLRGEDTTAASDLYALGVMLHEMLTGLAPFDGRSVSALLRQVLDDPPGRLPVGLAPLQPLLDALLAKDPILRFDTARSLIEVLDLVDARLAGGADLVTALAGIDLPAGAGAWSGLGSDADATMPLPGADDPAPVGLETEPMPGAGSDGVAVGVETEPLPSAAPGSGTEPLPAGAGPDASGGAGAEAPGSEADASTSGRGRGALFGVLAIVVIVVAAGAGWFLLSPAAFETTPLTLEVDPPGADVEVTWTDAEGNQRISAYAPGMEVPVDDEVRITARAEGFAPATTTVRVLDGAAPVALQLERAFPPAGTRLRDALASGAEGPELIVIPAGTFTMGCVSGRGCEDRELPTHEVRIPRPFAMGVHEVTFDAYDRFARATGRPLPEDQGWGRGRRPVINVDWADARAYAQWLSEQTGERYRLPSEAEWEYAARAGTRTAFWTGDCVSPAQANYDGNFGFEGCPGPSGTYVASTSEVGSYAPNAFGLADTMGNVYEWVEDCWHPSYVGAPGDGSAWLGAGGGDCSKHAVRGGSWYIYPQYLRSAFRFDMAADYAFDLMGFRIARDL